MLTSDVTVLAGESSAILLAGTVKTLGDLQNLPDQDMACRKQVCFSPRRRFDAGHFVSSCHY